MLVRVAERIRSATSFSSIAHCVIEELDCKSALVLCDSVGTPTLWIGNFDRETAHAYLDGGYLDDACFAAVTATYGAAAVPGMWVAPILGADGVIGMLRVATDGADTAMLTMIAAQISIRIALLGLALEDARSVDALTPRQREVAELVAHGCTNIEIGRMLCISPHAVKKHVSRVLAVLEVSNRTELAAVTGRWRMPTDSDQSLPPTIHMVLRNPVKPAATNCREQVA